MNARRLTSAPRKACLVAVAISFLAMLACCSSEPVHPKAIGGCTPEPNAPCDDPGAGAAGTVIQKEAGANDMGTESGAAAAENEGGTCGVVDAILSVPCGPCIAGACCMADSICSADPGCVELVECVQNGGACASLTMGSATNYQDLQSCFELNCAQQCQQIGNRDF